MKARTKMKYYTRLCLVGSILLFMVINQDTSKAQAPTPGSTEDPVITKSYFDKNNLTEAEVNQLITAALAKQPNGGNTGGSNGGSNPIPSTDSSLKVIQLQPGQTLYAGEGTEVIVRTGKTIAVSNDDGIPDVTSGKDIAAGAVIENNHLLIFPREGRGIKPDPKSKLDIYVMVRGGYLILDAKGNQITP
ncbi:hypothetical protein D3C73_964710 [compost metagenome]